MPPTPPTPPNVQLAPGTRIGHYLVDALISSGGFGAVYRVTRDGLPFALKLPLTADPGGEESRRTLEQRITREVVSLMTLHHPNIVRVHGFDRWRDPVTGALYLVMDFVEGVPLLEWRRNAQASVRAVVQLFRALALALDEMHRLGVIHRDIKSSNVLVRASDGHGRSASRGEPEQREVRSGASDQKDSLAGGSAPRTGLPEGSPPDASADSQYTPVLVDFGLARPAFTTDVTREYTLVGTEGLWAPEHAAMRSAAFDGGARFKFTPATDLHALGLLFYEALTGRRAVLGASGDLARMASVVPRAPSEVCPALPPELDAPVLRLLAKNPDERPRDGAQLADGLAALLAAADARWNQPVPTAPGTPNVAAPTSPQRPPKLNPPPPPGSSTKPDAAPLPPFHARTADLSTTAAAPIESPTATAVRTVADAGRGGRPTPPARPTRPAAVALLGALLLFGVPAALRFSAPHSAARPAAGTPRADASPPPPAASTPTTAARRAQPTPASTRDAAVFAPAARVRAVVTGPVRPGAVEAVLREPLVSRGLIVLPVGTALVGRAAEQADGGFALRFDTARLRGGDRAAVRGTAQLDARAGQRQPLRPGALPQQFDFELLLVTSR